MDFLFYSPLYLSFFKTPLIEFNSNHLFLYAAVNDNEAISYTYAPYGDIEGDAKEADIERFIHKMISRFEDLTIQSLVIKCRPSFIASSTQLVFHELLEKKFGFEVESVNVQHTLIVDEVPLMNKINSQEKRKLKALKNECTIKVLSAPEKELWFDLLSNARQYKGFPLTTTKYNYEELPNIISDRYYYIGAYKNDVLIASCVGIRVSEDIMYYYLPATHPDYSQLSPSVLLLDHLYQLASDLKIKYIDLGISNNQDGTLNHGLVRFKENMGGIAGVQKRLIYNF